MKSTDEFLKELLQQPRYEIPWKGIKSWNLYRMIRYRFSETIHGVIFGIICKRIALRAPFGIFACHYQEISKGISGTNSATILRRYFGRISRGITGGIFEETHVETPLGNPGEISR